MHDLVLNELGEALMVYREREDRPSLPWHGHGVGISEEIAPEKLLHLCGFGRDIRTEPLFWDGERGADDRPNLHEVEGYYSVVDSEDRQLGVVQGRYQILQDYQVVTGIRPLIENHGFSIETAGMLSGGAQTWIQLGRDLRADVRPGDPVESYVAVTNAHDGSRHLEFGGCNTRIVCANTLGAARGEGKFAKLRHSGDIQGKYDQLVAAYQSQFEGSVELWRAFAGRVVHQTDLTKFLDAYFGVDGGKRGPVSRENVVEAFESGIGNTGSTRWDLLNGLTQCVTYAKGRGGATEAASVVRGFSSAMFGRGAAQINRASDIISAML